MVALDRENKQRWVKAQKKGAPQLVVEVRLLSSTDVDKSHSNIDDVNILVSSQALILFLESGFEIGEHMLHWSSFQHWNKLCSTCDYVVPYIRNVKSEELPLQNIMYVVFIYLAADIQETVALSLFFASGDCNNSSERCMICLFVSLLNV